MECTVDGLGVLTTEHAASSHEQPVLLLGSNWERATGPGDLVLVGGAPTPAWRIVKRWMEATKPEGEALDLAEAFVALGKATRGE